jgi:hypothetical protein
MSHGTVSLAMPTTKTPGSVYWTLAILGVGLLAILWVLFETLGLGIGFAILGLGASIYTENTNEFHAKILLDSYTGKQRVIFQGLSFKLPWEGSGSPLDLRVALTDAPEETYASKDSLMSVKYVYSMWPDFSGDKPEDNIIRFSTFEKGAIMHAGHALFSRLLSDHYGENPGENLLKKGAIENAVFHHNAEILEFQNDHGVRASVHLEDSDFDKKTQEYRNMIVGAKSYGEAVQKLVEVGKMSQEKAEGIIKLMNLSSNVSESNVNIAIEAPDLRNMQSINITGTGGLGGLGGGKKGDK